jgi:hypothetical protein
MKTMFTLAASLIPCIWCAAQDADVEQLMLQKNRAVQGQIAQVYASLHQHGGIDTGSNVEAFRQLQELKDIASDQRELVKQLAIFAVSPGDEQQPLAAYVILGWLRIPSHITIDVLAPYLDTNDDSLRAFVLDFFHSLDRADSGPFMCVNYYDYLEYVRGRVNRNEEIPRPFIKYIYERSPAQGNALWLKRNKFDERIQAALPEAAEELKKLAEHEEWWARLYVAYIMRQNFVLRQDHILRQLAEDENEIVRDAADLTRR